VRVNFGCARGNFRKRWAPRNPYRGQARQVLQTPQNGFCTSRPYRRVLWLARLYRGVLCAVIVTGSRAVRPSGRSCMLLCILAFSVCSISEHRPEQIQPKLMFGLPSVPGPRSRISPRNMSTTRFQGQSSVGLARRKNLSRPAIVQNIIVYHVPTFNIIP
jgi:hypothetical protein